MSEKTKRDELRRSLTEYMENKVKGIVYMPDSHYRVEQYLLLDLLNEADELEERATKARIDLPMNSDGKSIRVTGPAEIRAPNAKWELAEGETGFLDVEDEVRNDESVRPWGWRLYPDVPQYSRIWPRNNEVWSICGNCDAPARGHIIERHCRDLPVYVMGVNPHEAERVECPGGVFNCRHEPAIAWRMHSGHIRMLNTSKRQLVLTLQDGDRNCRVLLGPDQLSEAVEGMSDAVVFMISKDTSVMEGKVTIIGGSPETT